VAAATEFPQRALADTPQPGREAGAPTPELRHVSVLFCDLVGFTPFSEKRDAEEVREVLSGYFELPGRSSGATAASSRNSSATR